MKKWSLECTWEKSSDWPWRSYGSMDFCSAGKDQKSCLPGVASTQNMFQKLKGSYSWLSLKVWKCTFLAIFKIFKDLQYQLKNLYKDKWYCLSTKTFSSFSFQWCRWSLQEHQTGVWGIGSREIFRWGLSDCPVCLFFGVHAGSFPGLCW